MACDPTSFNTRASGRGPFPNKPVVRISARASGRVLINAGIGRMSAPWGEPDTPADDGQRYSASETKILMPPIVLGHN
jgi:hypothetical protein